MLNKIIGLFVGFFSLFAIIFKLGRNSAKQDEQAELIKTYKKKDKLQNEIDSYNDDDINRELSKWVSKFK